MDPVPGFVADILPALYVAITRVRLKFELSEAELLCLFFLQKSAVLIKGERVLLLTDLLARLTNAMGYANSSRATDVVNLLKNKGFVTKQDLKSSERRQHFPGGTRAAAVFMNLAGEQQYAAYLKAQRHAVDAFVGEQPAQLQNAFEILFGAAVQAEQQIVLPLEEALLDAPPDEDPLDAPLFLLQRFHAVCKLFLKKDFSTHETQLSAWFTNNVTNLPDGRRERVLQELETSANAEVPSVQRRGKGKNTDISKFLGFLDNLIRR
jgi:hypothetical protein